MRIRPATPADADALAALGRVAFTTAFAAANRPDDVAAYLEATYGPTQQARELADDSLRYLIAEDDSGIAGYALVRLGAHEPAAGGKLPLELVRLYTAAGRTGQGIGALLMAAVVDFATASGHDRLWLGVWEHNPRAQSFYQRHGFRVVGTHPFQLGSDLQTDLVMARDVPRPFVGRRGK